MGTPQLLINLRTTAMHGVLLLCMNHPSLIRKSNYFKSTMVETYMRLLAEDETTPLEEWAHELLNENISKNDISVSCE